jgi:hypothetical protein
LRSATISASCSQSLTRSVGPSTGSLAPFDELPLVASGSLRSSRTLTGLQPSVTIPPSFLALPDGNSPGAAKCEEPHIAHLGRNCGINRGDPSTAYRGAGSPPFYVDFRSRGALHAARPFGPER